MSSSSIIWIGMDVHKDTVILAVSADQQREAEIVQQQLTKGELEPRYGCGRGRSDQSRGGNKRASISPSERRAKKGRGEKKPKIYFPLRVFGSSKTPSNAERHFVPDVGA